MDKEGAWKSSTSAAIELCTICAFQKPPALYFKGFCAASKLSWVYYPENVHGEIIYKGYKNSIIAFENGTWRVKERYAISVNFSKPYLIDDTQFDLPVGRRFWHFGMANSIVCPDMPSTLSLSLSSCAVGKEFSCSNGFCIPLTKRCDFNVDCVDKREGTLQSIKRDRQMDRYMDRQLDREKA